MTVTLKPDIECVHYSVTMLSLSFLQRLVIQFYHICMNKAYEQDNNCYIQNIYNVPAVLQCTNHI